MAPRAGENGVERLMARVLHGDESAHVDSTKTFWEQGGTSLMAMTLDGLIQAETGVKVGIARMMRDGSVAGLARIVEAEKSNVPQHEEESINSNLSQKGFLRLRRFGEQLSSSRRMLFISGFGLLAETALGFISSVNSQFSVIVCEFAGLDETPLEIAKSIYESLSPSEKSQIDIVAAHSAGGVYGFECLKLFEAPAELWLLDCYVPRDRNENLQVKDLLKFITRPFSEMRGLNLSELDLPSEILKDHLAGSLGHLGMGDIERNEYLNAITSEEMISMLRKMDKWKMGGVLECKVHYVAACENKKEWERWKHFFSSEIKLFKVEESHFKMLERCAQLILK